MQVKLVQEMSGLRNGQPWPGPGEVVDLPDDEANQMLINGGAVAPNQKHAQADARFAAKQKAEAEREASLKRAAEDAKLAVERAAADQKLADARAAAEAKAEAKEPVEPSAADLRATDVANQKAINAQVASDKKAAK